MKSADNYQRISVAMYISSFSPKPMGGMEIQGLRLAQKLKEQGGQVTIFTHGFKGCKKEDVHEGIQIVRLYSSLNVFFEYLQKLKKLKSHKTNSKQQQSQSASGRLPYDASDTDIRINGNIIDLIYYFIQFLNFAWQLRPHQKKYKIIHVHGVPWVSVIGTMVGKLYGIPVLVKESTTIGLKKFDDIILGSSMRRFVLKHAHFVAISRYIYKTMQHYHIPDQRIYYVPNGVNMPVEAARESTPELNLLFVGNLTQGAAKGLDVLLEALKTVIPQYPDAQLLIAGKTSEELQWSEYLAFLGIEKNVAFLGSKNNMTELYSKTTVFVSPSRREGLSNALLEAMAFGLPCIVTNISGSQDMIENGENGYVVEPDNASDLAMAIMNLLSSKATREVMRTKAYAKVNETCSFEKITKEYGKIYSQLLNSPQ